MLEQIRFIGKRPQEIYNELQSKMLLIKLENLEVILNNHEEFLCNILIYSELCNLCNLNIAVKREEQ